VEIYKGFQIAVEVDTGEWNKARIVRLTVRDEQRPGDVAFALESGIQPHFESASVAVKAGMGRARKWIDKLAGARASRG
jgi:hypothetical protein